MLSGHKKLIADKLAEEKAERHVKGEARKEKKMVIYCFHLLGRHDTIVCVVGIRKIYMPRVLHV